MAREARLSVPSNLVEGADEGELEPRLEALLVGDRAEHLHEARLRGDPGDHEQPHVLLLAQLGDALPRAELEQHEHRHREVRRGDGEEV